MCLICDRIEIIKNDTNKYFVKELETGYVVIGDYQHFKGYSLFLFKEHKTDLFQLDNKTKMKFLEEMSVVAEAVSKAFNCEKMNYELLGNGKGPVWWYPLEKMYDTNNCPSDFELQNMKEKLLDELKKII